MINVGMIGFGGLAQAHRTAYERLEKRGAPVRLLAACDTDPEQFKRLPGR